ncbi:phage tail tape measure C-terminal domain-containing protein [Alcaligenes faecalis]|uniref:phage tail tape measure C-terminal domain-containing protein n=1 Tax=Alcaligenes faecalis TaxID=511 RepID=UPI00263B0C4A|nr:phage tail tape measure C-terminal domain-containing protein [Alcaligenes faecalis]
MRKFAATAIDVSALTQQVFETAFENIEQTLFNFVKTGELDLRGLFVGISDEVLKMLIKIGVRMAVNAMLGETIGATTTTTSAAQAATIAAAWSGPATLVSLATQGANAVPASLGIANTFALTNLMGVAHKGIDRVPYEGTWLLDKGERVLSARQNSDLTDYLQDAGSEPGQAGAQGFQINVAVNMSQGDGQTQVDGDDMQGRQLGTLIAAQVQQTLSREMRQGGLLWNQRNGYSR